MSPHLRATGALSRVLACALGGLALFATIQETPLAAPPATDGDAGAARAHAALAPADWAAIRDVIDAQRHAFLADDAARAFSYATPGIQERFHDAPTFLAMVRDGYAPLLAARYAEFLDGAVVEGVTLQPLRLVMPDETVLVAIYEMRKDEDGRWRIAGCVIAPSTLRSI
jgi:hypothetical protein